MTYRPAAPLNTIQIYSMSKSFLTGQFHWLSNPILFKMELYLKHLNGPLRKKRQSVAEICCLVFVVVVVVVLGFYLLHQSNLSFGSFLMKLHILYSTMNHYSFKISPDIIQNISSPRADMLTLSCIYLSCNSV